MCLPAIGLVAGLASSAVSAAGAMSSAGAQANAAEYNATVERINARSNRQKGLVEQERISGKYDDVRGQGIAAAGKSGVDSGYGSAALVIFGDNAKSESQDKSTAYVNAEGAATANENKARDYDAQAKAHRQAGSIGAAGSFLSGLGGIAKAGPSLMINS